MEKIYVITVNSKPILIGYKVYSSARKALTNVSKGTKLTSIGDNGWVTINKLGKIVNTYRISWMRVIS